MAEPHSVPKTGKEEKSNGQMDTFLCRRDQYNDSWIMNSWIIAKKRSQSGSWVGYFFGSIQTKLPISQNRLTEMSFHFIRSWRQTHTISFFTLNALGKNIWSHIHSYLLTYRAQPQRSTSNSFVICFWLVLAGAQRIEIMAEMVALIEELHLDDDIRQAGRDVEQFLEVKTKIEAKMAELAQQQQQFDVDYATKSQEEEEMKKKSVNDCRPNN